MPLRHFASNKEAAAWYADHPSEKNMLMRHFVSNNGLYDVWALWNAKDAPVTTDLIFRNGLRPTTAIDVKTGAPVAVQPGEDGSKIAGVQFGNWETRVFLTPRSAIADAAAEWFDLQRHWWKGTTDPGTPPAPFKAKNALSLDSDWAFQALDPVPHGAQPPDAATWADPAAR